MNARAILIAAGLALGAAHASTLTLTGTVRDFKIGEHPDFENWCCGDDRGIVTSTLGPDGKPVYAGLAGNPSTHGQTYFDEWYRDTPGVNQSSNYSITLDNTGHPDVYSYANYAFFPIDDQVFDGEAHPYGHNYGFTYELNTVFSYQAGQVFSFTGDDDVFVYINGSLVIDLGGVHGAETQSVNLDLLGLTSGNNYTMNVFFAERHTTGSDFRIDTNIESLVTDAVPEPGSLALMGLGLCGLVFVARRRFA